MAAAPLFRVNFFFVATHNRGWSETYYNILTTYNGVMGQAQTLADTRRNLNGTGVGLDEIRVSDDSVKNDSLVYAPPLSDAITAYPTFEEADFSPTSLLCRADSQGVGRRSIFLRGIPDSMTLAGGTWTPSAQWTSNWNLFKAELQRGTWGVKVQVVPVITVPILLVTQQALTGVLSISSIVASGFRSGDLITIRGVRGVAGLNGKHRALLGTDDTTLKINSDLVLKGPAVSGEMFKTTYLISPFAGIIQERLVSRKTGGPFYRPHGRLLAR